MTIAQQLKIKDFPFEIRDRNGKEIYVENSDGSWQKREYDANGNKIFYEDSNGVWAARKYDANGNQIYFKNSVGFWEKREWDASGNQRYYENSHEFWAKYEYDADGNEIYYENSDGKIFDNRPESEIKKAIKILTKENLLEWVNHVADTSKMIDMQDAIADAYRKHVGRCGLQTYAQTYRQGWQDALALRDGGDQASGIEAMVCDDIAKRQQVGIAKYGTTVAGNPLTHAQWLQHAYEECLDMAVYLKRAMAEKGGCDD